MKFSIIIPTLNEASNIISCINSVNENIRNEISKDDVEVIIADGGSRDDTVEKAAGLDGNINLKIIRVKEAGLPYQLNCGVQEVEGDVLLFLHADCLLATDSLLKIRDAFNRLPRLIGGAFTMKVPGRRFFYRILSVGGNIYCRMSRVYFGDRAMFMKKDDFIKLSGFRPLAIMSDFDLSLRMKKAGGVMLLKGPVISSSRKFAKEPFYKILYLISWSIFSFFRGADSRVIKKRYYQ